MNCLILKIKYLLKIEVYKEMSIELAVRVRAELYKKKMSQNDLAKIIGISGAYLTDILKGRRTGPKAQEHIIYIKKILEIK